MPLPKRHKALLREQPPDRGTMPLRVAFSGQNDFNLPSPAGAPYLPDQVGYPSDQTRYNDSMKNEGAKLELEIDGRTYDSETVSNAMVDAIHGGAPVAVMGDLALVDNINDRLRWAAGTVYLIALHREDADEELIAAASSASRQLEQAREMFRAFSERWRESGQHDKKS